MPNKKSNKICQKNVKTQWTFKEYTYIDIHNQLVIVLEISSVLSFIKTKKNAMKSKPVAKNDDAPSKKKPAVKKASSDKPIKLGGVPTRGGVQKENL